MSVVSHQWDAIVEKIHQLYDHLGKSGKPKEGEEWTCLAAFVMEQNDVKIVSMATGTKCIGGNSMASDGSVVNDSHAEVIARRNLLRYFYDQLKACKSGDPSIFISKDGEFILKNDVKFHFYASQVPCGDASIIPMDPVVSSVDGSLLGGPPAKKIKCDIHRTGAKPLKNDSRQDPKGHGADYHVRGAVRIKPGRGDPTKSLSCSDKIAKWLYCGVQGALLSVLIPEPIMLASIIIGGAGPYDEKVFKEAVNGRSGLVWEPLVIRSKTLFKHSPDVTKAVRPCPAAIHWAAVAQRKLEVSVDGRPLGVTKKCPVKRFLSATKASLLKQFLEVNNHPTLKRMSYGAIKKTSVRYQSCKQEFIAAMGSWSEDKSYYENFTRE